MALHHRHTCGDGKQQHVARKGGDSRVAVVLVFNEGNCWQIGQLSQSASLKCLMVEEMEMCMCLK